MKIDRIIVGRGEERSSGPSPLVLSGGSEEVVETESGMTSLADRRSVSVREEWSGRVARLSQGLWVLANC